MKSNQVVKDILDEFDALEEGNSSPPNAPDEEPSSPAKKKSFFRRFVGFFFWGFLVFCLLLLAGGIALNYFFPSEKIRPVAEEELAKILRMPVSIESVNLSLMHGLDVKGLVLGKDKPLFKLDALILDYDLTQLLKGRFIINQVVVDKPDIYLESVDGVWNFQPILDGQSRAPKPEKKTEPGEIVLPPFGVDLKQFLIRDVRLTVNMDGHTHARIEGLNVEAHGKVNETEVDVGVRVLLASVKGTDHNLVVTSSQEPGIDVKTRALIDLNLTSQDLNRLNLTGNFGLKKSAVRVGEVLPVPDFSGDIDLSVDHKAQTLTLPVLNLAIADRNHIRLSAQAEKILTGPDFTVKLKQFLLHIEDAILWAGKRIPPVNAKGVLTVTGLDAMGMLPDFKPQTLLIQGGKIELNGFSASHKPAEMEVEGLEAKILIDNALVEQGVPQSALANVSIEMKRAKVLDYSLKGLKNTLTVEAKGANLTQAKLDFSLLADELTASLPELGTVKTPLAVKGFGTGNLQKGNLDALEITYSAGPSLKGKISGQAKDFGKQSFSVRKKLDLDLKAIQALLPKELMKKIGGTLSSGEVSLTADVKGKLNDTMQPVEARGQSDIDLKGVDAAWNDPPASVKGLWANVTLPVQFDRKRGVKIPALKVKSKFDRVQALDNWTVGPGEIRTDLSMLGHYNLEKPKGKLPITSKSQIFVGRIQSKKPELSVKGLSVDTSFKGDLYPKDVKNASVEGTVSVADIEGLKEIKTGKISTVFSASVNDLSLSKTQASVAVTVDAPEGNLGEGQIALGPLAFVSETRQNLKQGDVEIKKLSFNAPSLVDLDVQGTVKNWGKKFDVHAQVFQANLQGLREKVPDKFLAGFEDLDVQGTAKLKLDAKGELPESFDLAPGGLPVTAKIQLGLSEGGLSWPSQGLKVESFTATTDIDFQKGDGDVSGKLSVGKLFLQDVLGTSYLNPEFDFKYALRDFNKFTIDRHTFSIPNHGIRHTFSGRVGGLKPFLTGKSPLRLDALAKRLDISLSTKNTLDAKKALATDSAAAFLENFQADGTLHSLLNLKLSAGKKVEVDGTFEFEKFNTQIPAGVTVKNVTGKIPFNKTLLLDKKWVRPKRESFSASKKGFFSQLRDFSRYKNNLMIDSIDVKGQTLSNIGLDLLFKNNQLRAEKFLFDVLDGSVAGNLFVVQTAQGPSLNFSTEFAGLNFGALVGRSRAEEAAFSEIDGNLQFGLKVGQGSEAKTISLDQIFTKVAITRIGADTFDRALLFLDPDESKPAIVDTRAKLKLASPHKLLLTLENGNLSAEAWLKNKVLGDIIKAPELKRIPISSLKQFRSINDQLQVLTDLSDVLNLLAAQGVEFDEEGKMKFF